MNSILQDDIFSFICRHRRDRESSILKAIENGAETLFDIVSKIYADVDTKIWIFASSNVRLHVDYLAYQDKLPKVHLLHIHACISSS